MLKKTIWSKITFFENQSNIINVEFSMLLVSVCSHALAFPQSLIISKNINNWVDMNRNEFPKNTTRQKNIYKHAYWGHSHRTRLPRVCWSAVSTQPLIPSPVPTTYKWSTPGILAYNTNQERLNLTHHNMSSYIIKQAIK